MVQGLTGVNDGGAPKTAKYILQQSDGALTNAQSLGALATGLLKSTNVSGILSIAVAGTDYYNPGGTDVAVADGGTGVSSLTAYAPLFGGTTSTGPVQSGTVGTAGQVLTSNGAGALPTFQTPSGGVGLLSSVQVFTSSGTWTKPSGVTQVVVEVIGGGGGGGQVNVGSNANASGGGGGGYAFELITAGLGSTETVTIGAGGAGGVSATSSGVTGGTTSFGSFLSATGGGGGSDSNGTGGAAGAGSGGTLNLTGEVGQDGVSGAAGAAGGSSPRGWGQGGRPGLITGTTTVHGLAGTGYGAGGAGGHHSGSNGGAGKNGIVIIWEYK